MKSKAVLLSLAIVICCGLSANLGAQEGDGGYAGAFLRLGAGVRGTSMGGAFAAISDDITASYWNPAGLGQVKAIQFMGVYSTSSLARKQYYVGAAFPGSVLGTISFSWINLSINDIDGRDLLGNSTGTFSNSENAFYVAVGKSIADFIYIGGNVKYLTHNLAEHNATGISGDIGLLVRPVPFLSFALAYHDFDNHIKWDTHSHTRETIPATVRAGIALRPSTMPLVVALDIEKNEKQNTRIHLGAEYFFFKQLGFRVGFNHNAFTAGFSLQLPLSHSNSQNFDFSYALFDDQIDAVHHQFSSCLTLAPREKKAARIGKKPVIQGKIRALLRDFAYIDIGSNSGIYQNQTLHIFRRMRNGQLAFIGQGRTIRVKTRVAAIELQSVNEGVQIQVGDVVRPAN
jgi:hypothetical protein